MSSSEEQTAEARGLLEAGRAIVRAAQVDGTEPAAPVEPYEGVTDWTPAGGWPVREWLIPGWLPAGRLGMLSGRGGRGKSRLALQVVSAIADLDGTGRQILPPAESRGRFVPGSGDGPAVRVGGPVVFASWEDEAAEVGRRLESLAADRLCEPAALRGRLRFVDMRGGGPLWGPERGQHLLTLGNLTEAGRRLRATCERDKAVLLIVDSLAGAYGGDENSRSHVRAFCAAWDAWGGRSGCARDADIASAENAKRCRGSCGRPGLFRIDRLARRGALAVDARAGSDRA